MIEFKNGIERSLCDSITFRSHLLLLLLVLLDELLLLGDTIFASNEEKYHHDDCEYQKNDAPDDSIVNEACLGDPEEEADHDAKGPSDDADNEDRIFDDFFGGERVVIIRNSLECWFIRSHDLLVLILLAQSQLRIRSLVLFPDHVLNVVD
jgi:hypothetical protein